MTERKYSDDRGPYEGYVDLKEFFEAVLDEQRRGMVVAEQEREKAASALRGELNDKIGEGDRNLRGHMEQQIVQIREAILAANRLVDQQFAAAENMDAALRRELELQMDAAKEAIGKQERANQDRFESVNEFRAQSNDRERTQREETARLTGSFAPREVVESVFKTQDARLVVLEKAVSNMRAAKQATGAIIGVSIAGAAVFVAVVVFLANIVTSH